MLRLLLSWLCFSGVWGTGTPSPTSNPTSPTIAPTIAPSSDPTMVPTSTPSQDPTSVPTGAPSLASTIAPTGLPTEAPSQTPTPVPTRTPSGAPTPLADICNSGTDLRMIPTMLTQPGIATYDVELYPDKFDGCAWTIQAPDGFVPNVTIEYASINVSTPFCDDCPGECIGVFEDFVEVRYSCAEYYQLVGPRMCDEDADLIRVLCPATCGDCDSCQYNFVAARNFNQVEFFRSCGNRSFGFPSFISNTQVVFILLERGWLQRSFSQELPIVGSGDKLRFSWNWVPNNTQTVPLATRCQPGRVDLVADNGNFSSNTGGTYYSNLANCVWVITAPMNNYVQLWFETFDVSSRDEVACESDSVTVYDGDLSTFPVALGTYCGSKIPKNVTSTGRVLSINFYSDFVSQGRGFIARYRFVSQPGPQFRCSGMKTLSTPADVYQGGHYQAGDCFWTIMAPQGQYVKLEFEYFSIEDSFPTCRNDKVTITTPAQTVLMRLCGTISPPILLSPTSTIIVHFFADVFEYGSGFHFTATAVDEQGPSPKTCLPTQTVIVGANETGPIQDGSAYGVAHTGGMDCVWIIISPPGTHLHFYFQEFVMDNCVSDALDIYDGTSDRDPVLAPGLCGATYALPPTVDSSGNALFIRFTTDGGSVDGFLAYYEVRGPHVRPPTTACAGLRTITPLTDGNEGIITDGHPQYPASLADCTWHFIAPEDWFVELNVTQTHMDEKHDGCHHAYLGAYDGPDERSWPFFSTCGDIPPATFTSTGPDAVVRFVLSSLSDAANFTISWKFVKIPGDRSSHCGNDGPQGYAIVPFNVTIVEQTKPLTLFRKGLTCSWKISSANYLAALTWASMDWLGIYEGYKCPDYVKISLSPNETDPFLQQICIDDFSLVGGVFGSSMTAVFADKDKVVDPHADTLYVHMVAHQSLRFKMDITRTLKPPPPEPPRLPGRVIAGIVVGVVGGIILIAVVSLLCYRRKKHKEGRSNRAPGSFDLGKGQNLEEERRRADTAERVEGQGTGQAHGTQDGRHARIDSVDNA